MRAGQLKHKVTIQQVTETRGSTGEVIESWADYCSRKSAYFVVGGKEGMIANVAEQSELRYKITMRRDTVTAAITPKMRAMLDGRTLDIEQAYDPTGMRREINLI
jgi:SPP1 family predicted phage head-tail adaptor